jgi:hypothetical protein
MLGWRNTEKISWTDSVKNELLHTAKVKKEHPSTLKGRKLDWIGHILRSNCLLKQVTEGETEGTRRRGGKLLDKLHE